jgi:hypothetical protein
MLANDSVTLAVEVPIWLTPGDISALEREHRIKLRSEDRPAYQTITGHIDFLQRSPLPEAAGFANGRAARCLRRGFWHQELEARKSGRVAPGS